MTMADQRLVIASNRGPAQYDRGPDGERTVQRGGGGLVTALTGLVAHRQALWVASAMTDEDVTVAREAGSEPVGVELDGVSYDVCKRPANLAGYAHDIKWFLFRLYGWTMDDRMGTPPNEEEWGWWGARSYARTEHAG